MTQQRLKNFDIATLRSFVTIAETGSMTRAATRLYMTQSAISMQIKRLEEALGLSVFERSAQGMTTTDSGEQLLSFARQMLAMNDEAMGRLTSSEFEGQIRLGAPPDILYPYIPAALNAFHREFPRVQLRLSSLNTKTLLQQIEKGTQDIVLTTEPKPQKNGQVISKQKLMWTGAAEGTAWKQRPLPLGILKNCSFRPYATAALDKAGIDRVDIVLSENDSAVEAMISADLCVAAEIENAVNAYRKPIDHGGQLPELPDISIAMYRKDAGNNPLVDALAQYLERAFA